MGDQGRQAAEQCWACRAYGWHVEGCPIAHHDRLVADLQALADEVSSPHAQQWFSDSEILTRIRAMLEAT